LLSGPVPGGVSRQASPCMGRPRDGDCEHIMRAIDSCAYIIDLLRNPRTGRLAQAGGAGYNQRDVKRSMEEEPP